MKFKIKDLKRVLEIVESKGKDEVDFYPMTADRLHFQNISDGIYMITVHALDDDSVSRPPVVIYQEVLL